MNKNFSVFYNKNKERARRAFTGFQQEVEQHAGKIVRENINSETDVVVVVGGDGTLLRAGRAAAGSGKPTAYINVGTLGFLGERVEDMSAFTRKLLTGEFTTEKRILLQARRTGENFTALNDIVIKNGSTARVIELEININGQFLGKLRGDGVLVSTPTGSTAYSLAAGGPVLSPELESIVITPLNPHSLNSRSVVLPSDARVTVSCPSSQGSEVILTADGQQSHSLNLPEKVEIKKHPQYLDLISAPGSFFKTLSAKMDWGIRNERVIREKGLE